MPNTPDNHQLHIMLVRIDSKLDTVVDGQQDVKTWQAKHEEADKEQFDKLHTRISDMRNYGNSIALVAGFLGAGAAAAWSYIRKYI